MNQPTDHAFSDAIIAAAREVGALEVRIDPPFRWASGAMMPVYNDNRRLMANPSGRAAVRSGLAGLVARYGLTADAVAGTASAGIAPATLLAEELQLPLYYVRGSTKEHGRQRLIEGAPERIDGQRILLVEDLISTGGSSAAAAEALIAAGAEVTACLAIFSYGFAAATERFSALPGAPLVYPLATVTALIEVLTRDGVRLGPRAGRDPGPGRDANGGAVGRGGGDAGAGSDAGGGAPGRLSDREVALLQDWMEDPFGWYERVGAAGDGAGGGDRGGDGGSPRGGAPPVNASPGTPDGGAAPGVSPPVNVAPGTPDTRDPAVKPDHVGHRPGVAEANAVGVREFLSESAGETLLCVGLDPRPELIPGGSTPDFLRSVIDEIAASGTTPGAFKPNVAYFHQLDRPLAGRYSGSDALAAVINHVREVFPTVPLILDAKRGDIAGTSAAYAGEAFSGWDANAVTVSPFMGDDSVAPFLVAAQREAQRETSQRPGPLPPARDTARPRWVYVLNRTSNPGARRFQELPAGTPPAPLSMAVAEAIREWQREYGTAGAVIGATAPAELRELLAFHRETPIPVLIPGVGSQGGSAAEAIRAIRETGYPPELIRVNVSRQVVFPWAGAGQSSVPDDWRRAVRDAYRRTVEQLAWV